MGFLDLGAIAHAVLVSFLVVAVVLAVVILAMPVLAWVDDETVVRRPREVLEPAMVRLLAALPGVGLEAGAPARVTVRTRYTPSWAVLVAILAFPIGLIAPLLARQQLELYVRFLDEPGARTRVIVAGRTRRRVAHAIAEAVESLDANEPATR